MVYIDGKFRGWKCFVILEELNSENINKIIDEFFYQDVVYFGNNYLIGIIIVVIF